MKLTINTDVLKKYRIPLEQFIVLLTGYYNLDCRKIQEELVEKGLVAKDLFKGFPPVLSDSTRRLVIKILTESDDKLADCKIDFEALANVLRLQYPNGKKPGTTYEWRGETSDIAQKLRILVVKYDFHFTEVEAIAAVREYVSQFEDYKHMHLLRNFILITKPDGDIESLFMTIIENNRIK